MARKKKCHDDRKQLLIRYRIDENGKVSFIDPCCDDMPARLFCNIIEAISDVEKKWNGQIGQAPEGPIGVFINQK